MFQHLTPNKINYLSCIFNNTNINMNLFQFLKIFDKKFENFKIEKTIYRLYNIYVFLCKYDKVSIITFIIYIQYYFLNFIRILK